MPPRSKKQKLLALCDRRIITTKMEELLNEEKLLEEEFIKSDWFVGLVDDEIEFLLKFKICLQHRRYCSRVNVVPKSRFFLEHTLPALDEENLRQELRMSRDAFLRISALIQDHPIFHVNSDRPQAGPQEQLIVALHRFGTFGNAASKGMVSRKFGISSGTALLYTRRVVCALLSLEKDVLKWPTTGAKTDIKKRIKEKYSFPQCLGFGDGFHINLEYKPALLGAADYYTRKGRYAINTFLVCDDQRRILFINCGFPGSAHDNRVFKESEMGGHPQNFFVGEEYILADSAYGCQTYIIPVYKRMGNMNRELLKEIDIFNTYHSSARVNVEQCIGMVKGRFQSLRGLRGRITGKVDHARAVLWARACMVLHNLLLDDFYDPAWDINEDGVINDAAEPNMDHQLEDSVAGKLKRDRIRSFVLVSKAY